MNTVRTLTWQEVEYRYAELAERHGWDIEPMRDLVAFLVRSGYSAGLFPSLSHELLCIGRVADFPRGDGELQVRFDAHDREFRFEYFETCGARPWMAQCAAEDVISYMERLLCKRLRWFGSEASRLP